METRGFSKLRNSWGESLNSKPRRETREERESYRKENEKEEEKKGGSSG